MEPGGVDAPFLWRFARALAAPETTMGWLFAYGVMLTVFTAVQSIWRLAIMTPLYIARVPHLLRRDYDMAPNAVFHPLYVLGLLYFAVLPAVEKETSLLAAGHGALIGLMAGGAYAAACLATLRTWSVRIALVDSLWSAAISAGCAFVGFSIMDVNG